MIFRSFGWSPPKKNISRFVLIERIVNSIHRMSLWLYLASVLYFNICIHVYFHKLTYFYDSFLELRKQKNIKLHIIDCCVLLLYLMTYPSTSGHAQSRAHTKNLPHHLLRTLKENLKTSFDNNFFNSGGFTHVTFRSCTRATRKFLLNIILANQWTHSFFRMN